MSGAEGLARPVQECLSAAFPTPILIHDWPDSEALNTVLAEYILADEKSGPGLVKSNVGGWHSGLDFFDRTEVSPIAQLLGRIQTLVSGLIPEVMSPPKDGARLQIGIEGWANVLRAGEYNSLHNHPNVDWSGVYYVTQTPGQVAENGFAGKLEFVDPRPGASLTYTDSSKLYGRCLNTPVAGRMVMFPSWLQHFVHPFSGPGTRLSVAFNVTIRKV